MIRKTLYRLTGHLRCRLIKISGQPYLERYFLCRFGETTVYLHRFVSGDGDREVHDHPFRWSFSWVLAGHYWEEVLSCLCLRDGFISTERLRSRFSVNVIGPQKFHRIARAQPETWTLFVHGPRFKHWGFFSLDSLEGGGPAIVYHNPHDAADPDWHLQAPKGAAAGREPMGVC